MAQYNRSLLLENALLFGIEIVEILLTRDDLDVNIT